MLESWHDESAAESAPRISRRVVLAGSGGAMMVAAAGLRAQEGATEGNADELFGAAAAPGATVVLQDRRLVLPEDLRDRLATSGARLLTLDADPVRMWRGEHAALLTNPQTRLLGVTPWIEFVMIQGLAAESRRRARYQRFDAGNDAMVWLIA
jgi:hypothetical protein